MSRKLRTYYYAVLGALGGLIGLQATNLLGLSFSANIYLSDVVTGAVIGACIGLPIGAAEALISLNPLRAGRASLFSGLLGAIAGAVGLPLGEWIFHAAGAEVFGRALGWSLLGMLIGLAEGVIGGTEIWKGALGGSIGGFLGGALLEIARLSRGGLASGKAIGLLLLGASIGAFIALIVVLLSRAWLEVTSGKLKGAEFILDKFLPNEGPSARIGSSPLKAEIALPDPDIEPQHAILKGFGGHVTIKDISRSGTYVGRRKIEQAQLFDGSSIRMGNTHMVYHERR